MASLPNPAAERPLAFAVRHINASARDPIDAPTLLAALMAETVPAAFTHHVRAFFDEVEIETIGDLVRSGAVTYPILARGARRCLAPGHETRQWLDERA
ncbi:hypothetical protein [Methylobacterium haplocladii]|uniref:Uncharacterized protein n=1 Tax=Methylobacterium haplocladii TaxID=1176176 RepID=A0A512IMN8_9HYPH|nr:hypothetical protein [Methylobacterium haplocladii]GEO98979.1 hypothetical protein MHA02_13670 [Methylobacterium haplocladii]GJD84174.1 hypothetical protein HPGCJGGD_2049 [Methylobacterium haplocladii]GLS60320.1 hypothetical protein GCM10007887_29990 [Methylobacterium haplocladii]